MSCVRHPKRYARSLFGVIDLLAILPTYLAVFSPGLRTLVEVRMLRLLRIFRILKLGAYVREFSELGSTIMATPAKDHRIPVFGRDHRGGNGYLDVRRRRPRERFHQCPGRCILGHQHADHGGFWRHRAENRSRTPYHLDHDADGMGNPCGTHRYR